MNEVAKPEAVQRLQELLATQPQVAMDTRHYFADGMYCRELFTPAGTLAIGKVHKQLHFFMLTKGRMLLTTDQGPQELEGPVILVANPGSKRVIYAITDCICVTVQRTFNKELAEIEAELMEPEDKSLFDSSNKLKPKELEQQS